MKFLPSVTLLIVSIGFFSCKKDQNCICITTTSATADGEFFPLYEPTSSSKSYQEKLKDTDADEWCTNFEDSSTTQAHNLGFTFEIFEKTSCNL